MLRATRYAAARVRGARRRALKTYDSPESHLGRSADGRRVAGDIAAEFEIVIIEWKKVNKLL